MRNYLLLNGLSVTYFPLSTAFSISIGLYIKTGSRYENANNNGITHMLEHMHFRQMGNWSQEEIYYKMESIGGTLRASTYKDAMRFHMKIRPEFLRKAIVLFSELINTYSWSEEHFEAEKRVVLHQIRERDSYTRINPFIDKTVWGKDSLAQEIMGTIDSVNSLSLNDIITHKKGCFSKNNVALFVVGQLTEEDVLTINHHMTDCILAEDALIMTCQDFRKLQGFRKPTIHFEDSAWNYMEVNISFDVDINQTTPEELSMLNAIVGGGEGSLLPMELRERTGLSSNIYSTTEEYNDTAVLHILFSIDKKSLYEGIRLIMNVLSGVKQNITDSQFETNMPYFTENLWFWLENVEFYNFQLALDTFIRGKGKTSIEEKISQNKRITKQCLVKAANSIFRKENMTVTILGSKNKLTKKEITRIIEQMLE